MVALALERAPPARLPLAFLRVAPAWGVVAAALLLQHGEALFASRWSPATIAFVHAFTLGVLGNAILGSLLQFLPVVAGARPRLGPFARALPILFNAGVLLLVAGLLRWPGLLAPAGVALAATLSWFALGALAGLRRDGTRSLLRAGLAASLASLLATAGLGGALALGLAGAIRVPMLPLADFHAALGVVGGAVLLVGSVGSVVMPMFQGAPAVPGRALAGWIGGTLVVLALAVVLRWLEGPVAMARLLALPVAIFAASILGLQACAAHRRNPALVRSWRLGAIALLVAAAAPWWPSPNAAVVGGVLVVAVGLPSLVLGMALEIAAFLAWLQLQRERPRGRRVPGVDALLSERRKGRLLAGHVAAAIALVVAAAWPQAATARVAGALLALAYGLAAFELAALRRRTHRLSRALQAAA